MSFNQIEVSGHRALREVEVSVPGRVMICGSPHVIADLITGRRPAIETAEPAINRY